MARGRNAKIKQVSLEQQLEAEPFETPTVSQITGGTFRRDFVTHVDTQTKTMAYRRRPMIDILLDTDQIDQKEYDVLAYYRDQALLADKSPTRSCLDTSPRGGNGPGVTILSALIETGRIERDMGGLWEIARFIAVDDKSLAQWCITKFGGRERYDGNGKFVAIVPINEKRHMTTARMELRMAARRITI